MKLATYSNTAAIVVSLIVMLFSTSVAHASGGELPTLVKDIAISLLFAGAIAVVFARLKIPSIAAFILAGVIVGPLLLHRVTEPENIEGIAQIGFVLLLFVIGLEINIRSLVGSGRTILVAGAIQYPLTLLFGFFATKLLIMAGLGSILEGSPLAALYIGIAIAGSSSLLVVKLFQEHFELDTQPGRISLTILIFQDIWAIIITLIQPSLENPTLVPILFSFLGIGILVLIAAVLSRTVIKTAFGWIAKVPELILLGAVSWCFAIVAIGTNIDFVTQMFGFNWHMSVGAGMAALVAGATIASLPFSTEIITKVGLVKDFFITLFFVGLGITMPAISGWSVPLLALGVAFLAIVARQIVFFPLFYFLGIDQRNSEVTSIRLAQISEFGLVITFLGLELGHIDNVIASVIILAFIFTAVLTTPLFVKAYDIYETCKPLLSFLGFKEPKSLDENEPDEVVLVVLGLHRDASSFLHELGESHPELLPKTTVIDFNVSLHPKIRELGVRVKYGDISNEESLIHAGVGRAKIILCTISDDLLRGISNRDLVKSLRRLNPEATIIANAISVEAYDEVVNAGADIVYMSRLEVAHSLIEALRHALGGTVDEYVDLQLSKSGAPKHRREVMK